MEERTCLNCGTSFRGKYCPECGQAADTKRFTVASALKSLVVTLTGGDNTFFYTAVKLFHVPGTVARDFICGRRARYFRPVQMLLFLVTIFVLVSYFIDSTNSPLDIFSSSNMSENVRSNMLLSVFSYIGGMLSNRVTFALCSALIFVLPFRFVFRKTNLDRLDGTSLPLNSAEHFYALMYVSCQTMILSLVLIPLMQIESLAPYVRLIGMMAPFIFVVWTYCHMFRSHWFRNILKTILSIIVTIAVMMVAVIFVFGIFYGIDAVMQ